MKEEYGYMVGIINGKCKKVPLEEVAGTDLRVLICGGQGTRKQRYAEYLHGLSRRADRPYTRFDCSATHVSQYGRELMGAPGRKGIVEQCHGGTMLLDGAGNIIESDDGILTIGSGGNYALAAAKAMVDNTELTAEEIARKALLIAASICVFTNDHITVEVV